GTAVVEQRLDCCPDRSARVQDVVDEHDGLAFEREVEAGRADDRLRVARGAAAPDLHVVAVERDVDGAERGCLPGALLDEAAEALREGNAAGLDPNERDAA